MKCSRYLCRLEIEPEREAAGKTTCEFCEREERGLRPVQTPGVHIPIVKGPRGSGILTHAFREHHRLAGYYIERQVDAKGDITTSPLSKRAGERIVIDMGRRG